MANLATDLLRTTVRAFYNTDHILVIDALITHSTLPDTDLAHILGMQPKALRKLCGRLKEDGLLSIETRSERRTDGTGSYFAGHGPNQPGKERLTNKDWYYLNFHRAIDSVKYRMFKLNKHIENLGAPTTERKDLVCPQCKAQWTELEVLDKMDFSTGAFLCARCSHPLDAVEEDERASENESMKRLNSQLEKLLRLMQQIDATTVPENDWDTALAKQRPIDRGETHPGQRTEIVDMPNRNLQNSVGMQLKPEKIAVQLQNDEDVKRANAAAEAQARKEKEARQNALPDWIAKSTVSGDITAVGAKEERLRRERESHGGGLAAAKIEDEEEKKPAVPGQGDEDVMAAYWEEMAKAQAQEAAQRAAEDEEEDEEDEEDEFEDVDVGAKGGAGLLAVANGAKRALSTGATTPATVAAVESSNATDDEREAKRARTDGFSSGGGGERVEGKVAADTPAASDEDEDDDELEFENV
ncbi:hypothetical protein LTR08_008052 [Meristemomyces frigidus]|nr:hypothetical protein LTR08_008052 [Meristemomyces frigidus]